LYFATSRSGKPIERGLINPEGDQSVFGDKTAEVMGSDEP
jgi:hypothetical protein